MLTHLPLVILAFIYDIVLLREDDGKSSKFLAIVLLVVSILSLLAILAIEMNIR